MTDTRRAELRKKMRKLRRALPPAEQSAAAQAITARMSNQDLFQQARTIAAYLPFDGEVDTRSLITAAIDAGKTVCLPVLVNDGKNMKFAVYTPGQRLVTNDYGIEEPAPEDRLYVAADQLELVLTPLVAFDHSLNRIGMGAGYYDRCFSFLRQRKNKTKPCLIGLAHDFQRITAIAAREWDVPLSGVATEISFYTSSAAASRK
ncbi:MAG: 5-formyltetrahydrofolate cyclo-ligase [Gammaproteobacteria bacterium]